MAVTMRTCQLVDEDVSLSSVLPSENDHNGMMGREPNRQLPGPHVITVSQILTTALSDQGGTAHSMADIGVALMVLSLSFNFMVSRGSGVATIFGPK